ncbi:hypothetical protein GGR53DRAFT_500539 [Hypoxylon sp. FL1150]|nr:hypothetical protein GGR53DRAFT_500539 [Hypoxylon sp. FL1150]
MPGLSSSHWATETWSTSHQRGSGRDRRRRRRSLSPAVRAGNLDGIPRSTSTSQLQQHRDRSEPEPLTILQSRPSPQFLQNELSRFMKITARLRWKMPYLNEGYLKATETIGKSKSDIEQSEIQFKLDFHEFYMLIERALLRLMGIFQITVDGRNWLFSAPENLTGLAASRHSGRPHRFHENVLATLEDSRNPLSGIFRAPEVREQFARAKALRNRWKNIDEVQPYDPVAPPPLASYNLDRMVTTILSAIEQAHDLAVNYIREHGGEPIDDTDNWDFMVDAMDWEKV